jgi:hypothetical protein
MNAFNTLILKPAKPSLNILSFRKMTGGVYDVTASVSGVSGRDDTASLFRETVNGRMALVAGSYRPVESRNSNNIVRFTAKSTAVVKTYSDCAKMTSIGNAQFTDTAGDIWSVLEDGADRFLVLNSKDDLDDLLAEHKARNMPLTASYMSHEVAIQPNDFAAMVTTDGNVVYGFVVKKDDKAVLLDVASQQELNVDFACIIDAVAPDKKIDTSALAAADLKEIFAYLSKIYPPSYVAAFKKQIGA